jgi:hypothetical protein
MALTEVQKIFGQDVINDAETFQVRVEGFGKPCDAIVDSPPPIKRSEIARPGGSGYSFETARAMGFKYLVRDASANWVPNTATLIDERGL